MAVRFRVLRQVEITADRHMVGLGRRQCERSAFMSPSVEEEDTTGRSRGIKREDRRAKAGHIPLVRALTRSTERDPALC